MLPVGYLFLIIEFAFNWMKYFYLDCHVLLDIFGYCYKIKILPISHFWIDLTFCNVTWRVNALVFKFVILFFNSY